MKSGGTESPHRCTAAALYASSSQCGCGATRQESDDLVKPSHHSGAKQFVTAVRPCGGHRALPHVITRRRCCAMYPATDARKLLSSKISRSSGTHQRGAESPPNILARAAGRLACGTVSGIGDFNPESPVKLCPLEQLLRLKGLRFTYGSPRSPAQATRPGRYPQPAGRLGRGRERPEHDGPSAAAAPSERPAVAESVKPWL